jgi:glycosyltransferase involved in cell wall biosynthesis
MRIGVNALYLIPGGVGGTEIYLRGILSGLAQIDRQNEYLIFVNRETGDSLTPPGPNFRTMATGVPARVRPARILYEQFVLPWAARHVDVLFNPGFTAPLAAPAPSVTVFHDLQHRTLPHLFRWFDLPFWNFLLWGAAHRSRRLIAVSEFTRQDLLRFYNLAPETVRTVHHGVDGEFARIAERRRLAAAPLEPYLLCASTLHPHKNLDRLVRVFARIHKAHPEFRLVLAGMRGFFAAPVELAIGELGLTDAVTVTGWIPRERLYGLFERAWAFVYPSTFEGFGIPVLEALAAGIPTVASSIPPLREVAGEAALLVDPLSDDQLAGAIERVLCDASLRARLADAGPRRASQFSWERAAGETLHVLREAVEKR